MGKTQSKRSVDITTDAKKGPEDEVTGKLEKIEDIDQKQVNGDATSQENIDSEKKDADESENDKDLTTEKSGEEKAQASGENGDQSNAATTGETSSSSPKEAVGGSDTPKEGSAATEEISPLADESIKKSKKEKVKKKWSFRSISFGKKDKQKPAKTEDTENAAATAATAAAANGEADKSVAEGSPEAPKMDEAAGGGDAEASPATSSAPADEVKLGNGDATEKELNSQKTPTPTEEEVPKSMTEVTVAAVANNETTTNITTTITSNTTTTEETTSASAVSSVVPPVASSDSSSSCNNETAIDEKTETIVVSNGGADAAATIEKNGDMIEAVADAIQEPASVVVESEVISAAAVVVVDVIKSIPIVVPTVEKPHQNGTNEIEAADDEQQSETVVAEAIKSSQIEVKTHNTDTTPTSSSSLSSPSISSSDPNEHKSNLETAHDVIAKESLVVEEVVVEVSDSQQQQQPQQPPPLPISPPPSQVSVFAFKDHTDTEITTTDDLSTTAPPVGIESESQAAVDTTPLATPTEIPATAFEEPSTSTRDDAINKTEYKIDLMDKLVPTEKVPFWVQSVELADTDQMTAIAGEEVVPKISTSTKEIETTFLAAVVDEITDKAVEIVERKLQQNLERQQLETEVSEETTESPNDQQEDHDIEAKSTAVSVSPVLLEVESINVEEPLQHTVQNDEILAAINDVITQNAPTTTIFTTEDDSSDSLSSTIAKQIEKMSLNEDDHDTIEKDVLLISPTKEIANANELKENAVAAEVSTQDLPVTCE